MSDYDVEYDQILKCWCLHYAGEVVCLYAKTEDEAVTEAATVVQEWQPVDLI